ncbi:MAG: carbohydrate-binding, CenC-like protein [Moraxellaceae bacterium]|nr:carbohydrate-binding, CenC-like protein [Moraxellaceae bacterium]
MKALAFRPLATACRAAMLSILCALPAYAQPSPSISERDLRDLVNSRTIGRTPPEQIQIHTPEQRMPLMPHVAHRKGVAVIADFADARLEDWTGPGINSAAEFQTELDKMEEHWAWMSHGKETIEWDIIRITVPVNLQPDAFPDFFAYRDAVGALIRQQVNVADYDVNRDGVIDSAFIMASSQNEAFDYLAGGASRHSGVNMFVERQSSLAVVLQTTGNFNHELGHTFGLPDTYGPFGTLGYLTLMTDSWPVPPQDFSAFEKFQLGWLKPRQLEPGTHKVHLLPSTERLDAVRIPTSRPSEYFLIEYRRRPDSGFASVAPPYNGLAVYHVLEGSHQRIDPPLLKLEAADGQIAPDTFPELDDFLYPGNPVMQRPLVLRSYFGGLPIFAIDDVQWARDGGLNFTVKVLPRLPEKLGNLLVKNRLRNPSFEQGRGNSPADWLTQALLPGAQFVWERGTAHSGKRSVSIDSPAPNDARWEQTVSGLTPGKSYQFCGWLKGRNIPFGTRDEVGANISVVNQGERGGGFFGTFDWQQACLVHRSFTPTNTYACRLGFETPGNLVSGKVWCDDMTLLPLKSAFD